MIDKITLSLRNTALKSQIKKYAKKKGVTVSRLVENYLQNLVKADKKPSGGEYGLPKELDALLDGINVNEKLQSADYKTLRDDMYEGRT